MWGHVGRKCVSNGRSKCGERGLRHSAGRRTGVAKVGVGPVEVVSQARQACWSFLVCRKLRPEQLQQLPTLLGLDPKRVVPVVVLV